MTTTKRHIYGAGTVNVETGNVVVKQDINYFSANVQSATRSLIRFIEDQGKRFNENQIYDGLAISNGGADIDVASGTCYIGGRWVTVDADALDVSSLAADTYNVIVHVSGVSEVQNRDPSTGETINLYLEASGSWADDDLKIVLGSAITNGATVDSVQNRAFRRVPVRSIIPYGTATQVSIYTGTKPVYREAIRFTSDKIYPYNAIESDFGISGSIVSANSFVIGSTSIDQSEFDNLDGLDQPLKTTDNVIFGDGTFGVISGTTLNVNDINPTGDVDGRDIATDGAKLDTIESSAKDDQTAGEIEALVSHDNLLDYVGGEHFLQSAIVTVGTVTTGIWNAGSIATTGTVSGDILSTEFGTTIDEFSIDGTFAGDSDNAVPTEKATKLYVDTVVGISAYSSELNSQTENPTSLINQFGSQTEYYHGESLNTWSTSATSEGTMDNPVIEIRSADVGLIQDKVIRLTINDPTYSYTGGAVPDASWAYSKDGGSSWTVVSTDTSLSGGVIQFPTNTVEFNGSDITGDVKVQIRAIGNGDTGSSDFDVGNVIVTYAIKNLFGV